MNVALEEKSKGMFSLQLGEAAEQELAFASAAMGRQGRNAVSVVLNPVVANRLEKKNKAWRNDDGGLFFIGVCGPCVIDQDPFCPVGFAMFQTEAA